MRKIASIIKLIFLVIWSIFAIITAYVIFLVTLGNRRITVVMARKMWSPLALFIMGAKLKVEGLEHIDLNANYIIMANHSSYLDIPVLFRTMPTTIHFIGKKELKKVPLLGWYMVLSGMIFIDRENGKSASYSLKHAASLAKKGANIVIFPEGTTSATGEIAPFKKGGFILAKDSETPILPIRIIGSHIVWPSTSLMKMKSHKVVVKIGKPIPFEDYGDQPLTVNMARLREIIKDLN